MAPLALSLPFRTDNGTVWHLAQKHCSELLEDEQTWNPEAGVLRHLGNGVKQTPGR